MGIAAPDDSTLIVRLGAPTAYFLYLTQFYTPLPVPRPTVEKHGARWTRPENIVNNGPFKLTYWQQNNRFEFGRNPRYWDAAKVRLDKLVGYTDRRSQHLGEPLQGRRVDWNPSGYLPSAFIPYLREYADFRHGDYQGVYFYSMNVTRKPLDNVWVRRALNYAVDRDAIANDLLKKSRNPWGNFTPTGYPGYRHPPGIRFDPAKARECLAKAGYPGGKGLPKISILFNTSEDHRRIAEAIQAMWKRELGDRHRAVEPGVGLVPPGHDVAPVRRRATLVDRRLPRPQHLPRAATSPATATIARGWSDPSLRRDDPRGRERSWIRPRRLDILSRAEALLLADGPVIPIYHYSTNELVKPYVHGIYQTALDIHPLTTCGSTTTGRAAGRAIAERRGPRGGRARRSATGGDAREVIGFLIRRLLLMIPTLWVIATLTFFLIHAAPGGPFQSETRHSRRRPRRSS